jgi:large subunit ribosomal protein L21
MYAVIKTGGKQYRVKEGDVLKLELMDTEVGKEVSFADVLMLADGDKITCGTPFIAKAAVKAEVLEHGRHKKIKIIKFRRRKHHMKQMGHRQHYTQVKITAIGK